MADEQFTNLPFPTSGIELLKGFGNQRPGTTPVGTNVRTFEALTQRGRGGSRPGLAKYPPAQLPNGAHLIQCLDYVVDPSATALLSDTSAPPLVIDPTTNPPGVSPSDPTARNPDPGVRQVRQGGSGVQLNRRRKSHQNQIAFVQSKTGSASNGLSTPGVSKNLAFTSDVTEGNLLIVGALITRFRSTSFAPPNSATVAVTDSQGNTYTDWSGHVRNTTSTGGSVQDLAYALTLWSTVAASSGACTVTATVTASDNSPVNDFVAITLLLYEFTNNDASPQDVTVSNTGTSTTLTTTSVAVSGQGEMVMGLFFSGHQTYTPGAGFTAGANMLQPLSAGRFYSEYALNQAADITPTVTVSDSTPDDKYAAVGSSWIPS